MSLRFASHLYFVTIVFTYFRCDHEVYDECILKDIKLN